MTEPSLELYRKLRPTKFNELLGNPAVVKMLVGKLKRAALPHFLLFTGGSGCGKTTVARILKTKLKCSDTDFFEVNCADFRGIDMVREIRDRVTLRPMDGDCRIWLVDEVHAATKDAQNAFLKLLEDTPSHVYFFFCTTRPEALLPTIRTRATEIKLKPLDDKTMRELVQQTAGQEAFECSEEVVDKIVAVAEGSPRKALVLLNQILGLSTEVEQLAVVTAGVAGSTAIELARLLIKPRVTWGEVAKVLKTLEDEPESVRRLVLGYASSVLLSNGPLAGRAYAILSAFERHFFDSGKAGLVAASYEVVTSASR